MDGDTAIQNMYGQMQERTEEYAPRVTTLPSGVQVQRTPDDIGGYWHRPGDTTAYNTYYLNADNRGCAACHGNLADLIASMDYEHLTFANTYDMEMEVQDCFICHDVGDGYIYKMYEFGSLIHGIHSKDTFTGGCMSCHTATSDGQGLRLWDEAKYDVLQGITFLSDIEGEFSYDQDKLTATEGIMNVNWMSGDTTLEMAGADLAQMPLDEDLFNNWPISITGAVDNPIQTTLGELIKTAPSEKRILTNMCVMNPNGGPYISNVEITGIPMSWLLEQAGVQDGATAVMNTAPDGWARGTLMTTIEGEGAWLVYEMNGERLAWESGYPAVTFSAGCAAPDHIRRVTTLEVVTTPPDEVKIFDGWYEEDGTPVNKPSVGIYHFHEGQIIPAKEAYIFEGYAYAFDEQVTAVEFSLDRGRTWTTFSTEDSDLTRWVYWYFTYTPKEPGAYVLSVRAVSETGKITTVAEEILFNAK